MDKQKNENIVNNHIFSSTEIIDNVLNAIGLTRTTLSTSANKNKRENSTAM